jgi:hypothetical protein
MRWFWPCLFEVYVAFHSVNKIVNDVLSDVEHVVHQGTLYSQYVMLFCGINLKCNFMNSRRMCTAVLCSDLHKTRITCRTHKTDIDNSNRLVNAGRCSYICVRCQSKCLSLHKSANFRGTHSHSVNSYRHFLLRMFPELGEKCVQYGRYNI